MIIVIKKNVNYSHDAKLMSDDYLIHTRNYVNEYEEKITQAKETKKEKAKSKIILNIFQLRDESERAI